MMKAILALLIYLPISMMAQTDFTAMGLSSNSNGNEISISIGQVSFINDSTTIGDINFGVQQTYVSGLFNNAEDLGLDVFIFPNPTSDQIKLHLDLNGLDFNRDISFTIYDAAGRLVLYNNIIEEETIIDLSAFAQGNYLLHVLKNSVEIGAYKIIRS